MHVVTPIIALMINSPLVTQDDFKSLNTILGGAAPIGPTLINRLLEKAGKPIAFQEGYGMTEMSPCKEAIKRSLENL